jgi:hypothetical protein
LHLGRLRPSDCDALQRASFVTDIDDAPVGEVLHDQFCDPLDRVSIVERRRGHLGNLTHEVEPMLTFQRARDSSPFRRQ